MFFEQLHLFFTLLARFMCTCCYGNSMALLMKRQVGYPVSCMEVHAFFLCHHTNKFMDIKVSKIDNKSVMGWIDETDYRKPCVKSDS